MKTLISKKSYSTIKTVEDIRQLVHPHKQTLSRKFYVQKMGVFGSYAQGQARSNSDVDILVDLKPGIGFIKFIQLENYLSDILGQKVDLVSRNALKPFIGERILNEVQML